MLRSASSGHLTPATIDATLREFAIARGAEYTDDLARLAETFVNGLIDVVNDRSQPTGPAPELFVRLTRLYFELLTRFTDLQTAQIDDCLRTLLTAGGDEAASEANPDLVFAKVDTEDQQQLAAAMNITSIPTIMAFKDGIGVFAQAGALPRPMLDDLISQVRALDMDRVRAELAQRETEQAVGSSQATEG